MPRPNGDYSRETSQERRRRRIEIRRNAAVTAASGESLSFTPDVHLRQGGPSVVSRQDPHQCGSMERADLSPIVHHWQGSQGVVIHQNQQQGGSTAGAYPLSMTGSSEEDPDEVAERNLNHVPGVVIPVVGAVAVAGMLQRMEDAVTVQTNLCSPTINHCHPVHFFGVFDGHGGPHVAMMCRDWMHVILEEELMRFECPILPSSSGASSSMAPALGQPDVECFLKEAWTQVFQRCFSRTEELAMNMCQCGRVGFECSCNQNWLVYSGSAAVVVVLTDEYIVAANCGDSRAILCCSGSVIPLSVDHKGPYVEGPFILLISGSECNSQFWSLSTLKPNRPDELARIEASGGCVFVLDGAPRVRGILAMSRSIGDGYLKPSVISVPEISFVRRTEEQEFFIIATDGLWDVMSSEMTCHVVRECLRDERSGGNEGHGLLPSLCASAAGLLTNLAIARGSADNITVVVVDLKRTVTA